MIAYDVPGSPGPLRLLREDECTDGRTEGPLSYGERREMINRAADDRDLTAFALRVLIKLEWFYNGQEGAAWPSQELLAEQLGALPEAVSRAIRELVKRGYVLVEKRGRANRYRLRRRAYAHDQNQPPSAEYLTPVLAIDLEIANTGVTQTPNTGVTSNLTPVLGRTGKGTGGSEPVPEQPTATASPTAVHRARPAASAAKVLPPTPTVEPRAKAKGTRIPDDYEPTEAMIAKAVAEKGLTRDQVLAETETFKSHHGFRGTLGIDWHKGWWTWINNARPGGRFGPRSSAPTSRAARQGPSREQARSEGFYDDWGPAPRKE